MDLSAYGGLTADTEVLTRNGWRKINQLKKNDVILTKNIHTNEVVFQPIRVSITYPFTGKLWRISGRGGSVLAQANTLLDVVKYWGTFSHNDWTERLLPIGDITTKWNYPKWAYLRYLNWTLPARIKTFAIPGYAKHVGNHLCVKTHLVPDYLVDKREFTKLLAWYLSEGSIIRYTGYDHMRSRGKPHGISIAQMDRPANAQTRIDIMECCSKLGYSPHLYDKGITVYNVQLARWLAPLGWAHMKYFPLNIFDWFDNELAQIFAGTYVRADGRRNTTRSMSGSLITTSERLRDDLQLILALGGYGTKIGTRKDFVPTPTKINPKRSGPNKGITHRPWNVYFSSEHNRHTRLQFRYFSQESFSGQLFHLAIDNDAFYIRHNLACSWIGAAHLS